MSLPSPLTVQTPLFSVVLPATATVPMSADVQPPPVCADGREAIAVNTIASTAVVTNDLLSRLMAASLTKGVCEHGSRNVAAVVTGHRVAFDRVRHRDDDGSERDRRPVHVARGGGDCTVRVGG